MKKKVAVTVALFCLFIFALAIPVRASSIVWNKTYGGADTDSAEAVIQTSDGGYALAGAVKLVKTDSEGNMQWSQIYSIHDSFSSVIQTSDGGYVLSGTIIILVDDIPYDNDAWLIKTDSEGIIPEFPSWLLISLFIVATLLAVITYRRLTTKTSKP